MLNTKRNLASFYPEPFAPFGEFRDTGRYGGFVPSSKYLSQVYIELVEKHSKEMDQLTTMLPARILALDHSFKVSECVLPRMTPLAPDLIGGFHCAATKAYREGRRRGNLECSSFRNK